MAEKFDILLKDGHVIDPANDIDSKVDVAIKDKKIAKVEADIPESEASQSIDVSDHYVTPGIIDIHTHVYTLPPGAGYYVMSVNADAHFFASGVTTTVDAGTVGWWHFADFKKSCMDAARVRILALVNIASGGMVQTSTEQDPKEMHPKMSAAVVEAYPDVVIGIKAAHYWTQKPWDDEHPPWASVENAVEAGEICGKPVMVDFWPRPPERPYPDLILEKLRPGDMHTHVFARQFPIITDDGKVYDYMYQARDRGVIFDLGHGAGSFWFRNAYRALENGFAPDSISTDLHMGNINGPVVSMINTMSKYLSMGMPVQDVIKLSTVNPAKEIGHPELGTLSVGAEADVAVLEHLKGKFGFADCGKAKLTGSDKLECVMTIRAGDIVYDPTGMSMPEWVDAPEPYWEIPDLQK
ncbi:amidohydrolase/deacetylase family metallohydrolase [Candidatus Poribacteria bacterium]|nr:amidohydrolase/deacetylase family metallohydrolase [Candidatus Poribacteria bacterium]